MAEGKETPEERMTRKRRAAVEAMLGTWDACEYMRVAAWAEFFRASKEAEAEFFATTIKKSGGP